MKKQYFLIFICIIINCNTLFSQFTSSGTDFYFTYIQNRIDRYGAPTNCLFNGVELFFYINNNTSNNTQIQLNFNGNNISYEIDGTIHTTAAMDNIYTFTLLSDESKSIKILPVATVTYDDVCPGIGLVTVPDYRQVQLMNNCQIQSKTYIIRSLDSIPITVFAESTQGASRDASVILPISSLGNEYYAFSEEPQPLEFPTSNYGANSGGPSEIAIVAGHNNTQVNFQFPNYITSTMLAWSNIDEFNCNTLVGGSVQTITLNKGEAYQIQSDNFDLTGTRLWSTNGENFAVFAGNMAVPIECQGISPCGCDHLYEQMFQRKGWNTTYVIPKLENGVEDVIKIIAIEDNTEIFKDGVLTWTLNTGEWIEYINNSNYPIYIESINSHPISVALYGVSSRWDGSSHQRRDPSMIAVAPLDQGVEEISFPVLPESSWTGYCNNQVKEDYLNIIAKTSETSLVYLNDFINTPTAVENLANLSVPWTLVSSNPLYSYCVVDLSNNSQTNPVPYKLYMNQLNTDGFNAYVSGFDCTESYGYCLGLSIEADTLLNSEIVNYKNLIQIYPNPTTGTITIQAKDINRIEVMDITGNHLTGFENLSGLKEIDLSQQPQGIYFIKVTTNKQTITKKIIKQ